MPIKRFFFGSTQEKAASEAKLSAGIVRLFFDWWYQATWSTKLFTFFRGEFVGEDQFGNRYFQQQQKTGKDRAHWDRPRRWVIYRGIAEASAIPPGWNAWLQHTSEAPPEDETSVYGWEKGHLPNLTGTNAAYHPPGSMVPEDHHVETHGDYESWRPE